MSKLQGEVNQEQIDAWKKSHADVFAIQSENSICYLKTPSRAVLGAAMQAGKNNPLKLAEVLLKNCWLGGDEAFKTDDQLFLAASGQMDALIEVKTAEIKKL